MFLHLAINKNEALQKVIFWAENIEYIDALILTGSLALPGNTDALSDIDIAVFGTEFNFIDDDLWLTAIGNYWVSIHDQFSFDEYTIPTRLIIFSNGLKIDFSFHPVELLRRLSQCKVLPDAFRNGYLTLLDKKGLARLLPEPDHKAFFITRPGVEAFQNNCNEFWFECYHIAKYLKRNDLWTAKVRDGDAKVFLLRMLEWHHAAKCNWNFRPKPYGRGMQSWLDESLWTALSNCYAHFDAAGSWAALEHTITYYRSLAVETAAILCFEYDHTLDNNISTFINRLQTC